MKTLDIRLAATQLNSANRPFAEVDMALSTGTLLLFEPGHPTNPAQPVIPEVPFNLGYADAVAQFPNLAERSASLLVSQATFDATLSIANGTATASALSGNVNHGDEIWNAAQTILIAVVANNPAPGATSFKVTPQQTLASQAVKIKPGIKPLIHRYNTMRASGEIEQNYKYEYTPKGGLHMASSRTTMAATSSGMLLTLSGAIKKYMFDNPSHEYALSLWYKVTAPALAGYTGPYVFPAKNSGSASYFHRITLAQDGPAQNFSRPVGAKNTVGMVVEQMSGTYAGTALSNAFSDFLPYLFAGVGGPVGAFGSTYGQNKSMSAVLYRATLEDLTAAGRTYAQFKSVDDLAYAAAFTGTGRYVGDSNTAPGTLIA